MKVFISWSGELSRQVAELLNVWLGRVLQGVEPWISTEDIDKGSIWFTEISAQLAETDVGILCLTRANIASPWILFEAGALSKGVTQRRVCPILIDLEPGELKPPLSQFNVARAVKDDMLRLVGMIRAEGEKKKSIALREADLRITFDTWWRQFETEFDLIKAREPVRLPTHRRTEDKIDEILDTTRSLQRIAQQWSNPFVSTASFSYIPVLKGTASEANATVSEPHTLTSLPGLVWSPKPALILPEWRNVRPPVANQEDGNPGCQSADQLE
jgi:TIR domain